MLIVLFVAFFAVSLGSVAVLVLHLLPATPGLFIAIAGLNSLLAWMILRAYLRYYRVFHLVSDGAGELFDLAISHLEGTARGRLLRHHYGARRAQGLVASGDALGALAAVERLTSQPRLRAEERLNARVTEVEANLLLDQRFWADRALAQARALPGARRHPGLRAVEARVSHLDGDAAGAAQALRPLTGRWWATANHFPLQRVTRARNLLWRGEALAAAGDHAQARRALEAARGAAPASFYGQAAARAARALVPQAGAR